MNNIIINAINTTINKNNNNIDKILNDLNKLHLNDYIKEPIELLNLYAIVLSSNKELYDKFIYPKNKIKYKEYENVIKNYDEDEIINFVTNNINFLSGIGNIQQFIINKFLYTCEEEELFDNGKLCTNMKNILNIKKNIDKDILKKYIRASILVKSANNNLYVKPIPLTIEDYIELLKENHKYSLSKVNNFKKMRGTSTFKNEIILNIDNFSELYLSFINIKDFYIELEKVINHEIYHQIQKKTLMPSNTFPSKDSYNYIKQITISLHDYNYYKKNHDYFEIEINANIYAYKELIKKYKKDYIKNKDIIDKLEKKLYKEYAKKCTKQYDGINNNFDFIMMYNKNICKHDFFKYEYDENKRKSLKGLIESKKIYENDLNKYIRKYKKTNKINDTIMFKKEMGDKEFINDIIFNGIYNMPMEHIEMNLSFLDDNDIKIIKEALLYGKIKYINRYNTIKYNKSKESINYIKECLNKIENINILIQTKNLNKRKRR